MKRKVKLGCSNTTVGKSTFLHVTSAILMASFTITPMQLASLNLFNQRVTNRCRFDGKRGTSLYRLNNKHPTLLQRD